MFKYSINNKQIVKTTINSLVNITSSRQNMNNYFTNTILYHVFDQSLLKL